jgi:hypothetical protein
VHRFDGTTTSARQIFGQLLGKRDIVLQIHRELITEDKMLGETKAGQFLLNHPSPMFGAAGNCDAFQRRVGSEIPVEKKSGENMKAALFKGFLGMLGLIVGLGNLFLQIGVA